LRGKPSLGYFQRRGKWFSLSFGERAGVREGVFSDDNNDVEMNRGTVKDGDMDARDKPVFPIEEEGLCQYLGSLYGFRGAGI
jgi:hypothetical protein